MSEELRCLSCGRPESTIHNEHWDHVDRVFSLAQTCSTCTPIDLRDILPLGRVKETVLLLWHGHDQASFSLGGSKDMLAAKALYGHKFYGPRRTGYPNDYGRTYPLFRVTPVRGKVKYMAGCRNFTYEQAVKHWGSDRHPNLPRAANMLAQVLAWPPDREFTDADTYKEPKVRK